MSFLTKCPHSRVVLGLIFKMFNDYLRDLWLDLQDELRSNELSKERYLVPGRWGLLYGLALVIRISESG